MTRAKAILIALVVAALDVVAVTAWWRVREARRLIVAAAMPTEPSLAFPPAALGPMAVETTILAICGVVLLAIAIPAARAGFAWTRGRNDGGLARCAMVVPAVMAGFAGAGLVGGAYAWCSYIEGTICDPYRIDIRRYGSFAAHGRPYDAARIAILVTLVLATAFILLRARRPSVPSAPRLFAPIAMFALGLGAFVATRAEAHDVRHPMPLRRDAEPVRWTPWATVLPPASGCSSPRDALVLTHDERGWTFNGVRTSSDAELMLQLDSQRRVWRQVQPNKPFPGRVAMALPATMPMEDVRPVIATLRRAGYPSIEVLEVMPAERWPTRTLGDAAYWPRVCSIHVADSENIPPARTWGEMARALGR